MRRWSRNPTQSSSLAWLGALTVAVGCQSPGSAPTPGAAASSPSSTFESSSLEISLGGRERQSRVHLPEPRPLGRLPLVVALNAGALEDELEALADRRGFAVVFPEPIDGHWNDGRAVTAYTSHREAVDDVAYLVAVIDALHRRGIDAGRVYALGLHEGALMVQRLACERAERVAAIAAVGGTLAARVSAACAPARPVSVLSVQGTPWDLSPWAGGMLQDPDEGCAAGEVLSVDDTVVFWAVANDCRGPVHAERTAFGRREVWEGDDGRQVMSLALSEPAGHAFDVAAAAWAFFAGKTRVPEVVALR